MASETMSMNKNAGLGLGWIGVIVALIGFFFAPVWMGIIAIVLGAIALGTPAKGSAWGAIILGLIVLIWPGMI